jgi:hypothetical protein
VLQATTAHCPASEHRTLLHSTAKQSKAKQSTAALSTAQRHTPWERRVPRTARPKPQHTSSAAPLGTVIVAAGQPHKALAAQK